MCFGKISFHAIFLIYLNPWFLHLHLLKIEK